MTHSPPHRSAPLAHGSPSPGDAASTQNTRKRSTANDSSKSVNKGERSGWCGSEGGGDISNFARGFESRSGREAWRGRERETETETKKEGANVERRRRGIPSLETLVRAASTNPRIQKKGGEGQENTKTKPSCAGDPLSPSRPNEHAFLGMKTPSSSKSGRNAKREGGKGKKEGFLLASIRNHKHGFREDEFLVSRFCRSLFLLDKRVPFFAGNIPIRPEKNRAATQRNANNSRKKQEEGKEARE